MGLGFEHFLLPLIEARTERVIDRAFRVDRQYFLYIHILKKGEDAVDCGHGLCRKISGKLFGLFHEMVKNWSWNIHQRNFGKFWNISKREIFHHSFLGVHLNSPQYEPSARPPTSEWNKICNYADEMGAYCRLVCMVYQKFQQLPNQVIIQQLRQMRIVSRRCFYIRMRTDTCTCCNGLSQQRC